MLVSRSREARAPAFTGVEPRTTAGLIEYAIKHHMVSHQ
jgi:hypothetical protein